MRILSIDTSCDDTSVAITIGARVYVNSVSSQIEIHKKTGGVVPIDAARAHDIKIQPLIDFTLKKAKMKLKDIDAIAVTFGPGLAPALQVGITKAKELTLELNIPLIPVNHMSGHIYANWAKNSVGNGAVKEMWPTLALLVSGGHTEIVNMLDHFSFQIVGETLDDACGECFDKVGRMMGLGYPAGPVIEEFATHGDENLYSLPRPMQNSNDFNVSYSGLKTAAFRLIKTLSESNSSHNQTKTRPPSGTEVFTLTKQQIYDICASFQKAAIDTILIKLEKAIISLNSATLVLGGGVVKNKYLRKKARELAKKYNLIFHYPPDKLIMDNAAMIGVAGYYQFQYGKVFTTQEEIETIQREPSLRLQ